MNNFITIHYFVRPKKVNSVGMVQIYCRISQGGHLKDFSLHKKVELNKWDRDKQRSKGTNEQARTLNYFLDNTEILINQTFTKLLIKGKTPDIDTLFHQFNGAIVNNSVISILESFIKLKTELLAHEGTMSRINRYKVAKRKLVAFMIEYYGKSDLDVSELKLDYIENFRHYLLKSVKENTATTYLKILKKIGLHCFNNSIIDKNPFVKFKCSSKYGLPKYLTNEELNSLMNVKLPEDSIKLEHVLDVFIFCCFTGLAHCDVFKMTKGNIIKGMDGKAWIEINRQKTSGRSSFPLLPIPLQILEKYKDNPKCINENKLLPVISNQKMNDYLKLIALYAGIDKKLTSHIARHSFATLSLTFGTSLETVSKNLGHSSTRITSIYAKVVDGKVSAEMNKLEKNIAGQFHYSNSTRNQNERKKDHLINEFINCNN